MLQINVCSFNVAALNALGASVEQTIQIPLHILPEPDDICLLIIKEILTGFQELCLSSWSNMLLPEAYDVS